MDRVNNIAKNTSYLTLALVLQKIISFTYFALLARNLGPANLGKYYFAISFASIFAVFIDFGMANVLTREVARNQKEASKFLNSILVIRTLLSILILAVIFSTINLMGYPLITRHLVYLASICVILDSFTAVFYSVIRGCHNLKFESLAAVIFQIIVLVFGLSMLYAGRSLVWIMGALVLASLFNFFYSYIILRIKFKIKAKFNFNFKFIKAIFILAIPFGIFGIFQRVYMYLDTVFLSIFAGDVYVGYYQIAFKMVFALQFLPMAFTASLYPAMSAYWARNRRQLAITFERSLNYLIIISLPIAVGIIVLADKIILLFKSGYGEAILPIQIIMAALLFIFLNFPIGSLLNACDRQKINTINIGIVLFTSIILNLILIPRLQAVGASITVLATNFFMFIIGIYWSARIVDFRAGRVAKVFIKALAAALIMAGIILSLKQFLNMFLLIILAGIIYFIVLFLIKGIRREDFFSIYNSFIKKGGGV